MCVCVSVVTAGWVGVAVGAQVQVHVFGKLLHAALSHLFLCSVLATPEGNVLCLQCEQGKLL